MNARLWILAVVGSMALLLTGATPRTPATPPFQRVQLLPVDGATGSKELMAVREALQRAVAARDAQALLEHVHTDIKCSFGGESGKADFISMWGLQSEPEKSPLWVELGEVLRLGGGWSQGSNGPVFMAPYVFSDWPDAFDSHEFGAIVGDKVNVRAGPGREFWIVEQVNYLIVRIEHEAEVKQETLGDETFPWQRINLPSGQIGYVWGKYLRSPLGYRAGFQLVDGRWQMVSFLAGD